MRVRGQKGVGEKRMKQLVSTAVALLWLTCVSSGQGSNSAARPSPNPDDARIVATDITNFWHAYELFIDRQVVATIRPCFPQDR